MGAFGIFIIIFVLFIIINTSKKTTTSTTKSNSQTTTVDEIPETFIEFPEYSGVLLEKPQITTTSKYVRITMLYNDYIDENYIEKLQTSGFKKASSVRYDKDNTYVIVEEIDDTTKIAFHIKNIENNKSNFIDNSNPIAF